jgi:hypothetical protein
MKNSFRPLVLAASLILAGNARAQLTYTNASNTGDVLLHWSATIQTFSGFSSLSSATWTVTNTLGPSLPETFTAYIAQWDPVNHNVVGSLTAFGSTIISPGFTGSAGLTFNAVWTAPDSALTYALLLTGENGIYSANLGANPNDSFFGSGGTGSYASPTSDFNTLTSDLQTPGVSAINTGQAYTMSVTGTLAPVPEPKTAAAGLAALFVAALVGRRVWQRRKAAAAPLAA